MADEMAAAIVKIGANISDFETKMSKVEKTFSGVGQKAEALGKALSARVTLPLLALGAAATKFATDMDSMTRGLRAVAGSSAETERQLKRLREVARLPGLGFEEAIAGSVRLQAAGFSATLAEDALKGFGNALATVGAGKAELDQVTRALSQIASKGKISAEEINQIAEVVPQIRVVMQEAFGTSNSELLTKAGIDATEFVRKVTDELLKLEQVTGGPANAFENLSDSAKLAAINLGNTLLAPVVKIADGLAAMAERIQTVDASTMKTVVAWGAAAAAVGPLLIMVGKLTAGIAALSTALRVGLVPLLGAGGVVIVGLTALSAWFIKNKLDAIEAAGAADDYKRSLSGLSQSLAQMKFDDISAQISVLEAERKKTPEFIGDRFGGALMTETGEVNIGRRRNPAFAELTTQIDELYEQWRIVVRRMSDLQNQAIKPGGGTSPTGPLVGGSAPPANPFERLGGMPAGLPLSGPAFTQRTATAPGRGAGLPVTGVTAHDSDARVPIGPAPGFLDRVGSGLAQVGQQLRAQVSGIVSQFGPLAAIGAALRPVFQGLMETLGPTLAALAKPLRVVGQLLGSVIAPILKLLAPPLELLAKGVSYVVEAFGWLIEALGRFVDSIVPDWISKAGKGLARMGQELQDGAREARRALDSTTDGVVDLGDAVTSVAESITNQARIINLNLLRFRASGVGGAPTIPSAGGPGAGDGGPIAEPGARPPIPGGGSGGTGRERPRPALNIERVEITAAPGDDGEALWRKFSRTLREKVASGEVTELQLAVAGPR